METSRNYRLPGIELLDAAPSPAPDRKETAARRALVQRTLDDFKLPGKVVRTSVGASVTRFEIQPEPGVRLSGFEKISPVLAERFSAAVVRFAVSHSGKRRFGFEIPNERPRTVKLREVFDSPAWRSETLQLPIAIGTDLESAPVILDLARAPHVLIAGEDEKEKNIGLDAVIMSLLFRFAPDELNFVLMDSPCGHLAKYRDLPHCLAPLGDGAAVRDLFRWLVEEIERRYRVLADAHVKNIHDFNRQAADPAKMPYIVAVVDELAEGRSGKDKSKVEMAICRIGASGRAAGIHLIAGTHFPSEKVLSGLIRSNFPTRICFKTTSAADSCRELLCSGAERLCGNGDMLLDAPEYTKRTYYPMRVQAASATDDEIRRVIEFARGQK